MSTTIDVNPPDRKVHDIWIEPSAAVRAEGVNCVDPQHGGSVIHGDVFTVTTMDRPLELHDGTTAPPCAATAALQMGGDPTWHGRICLREDAGVDDFVAAAILSGAGIASYPFTREMFERLAQLARADNASYAGLPDWSPGQKLHDVTSAFPGLARLCACKELPVERRVELVRQWLEHGDFHPRWQHFDRKTEAPALFGTIDGFVYGNPDSCPAYSAWMLYDQSGQVCSLDELDWLAREELRVGRKAMVVQVFGMDGELVELLPHEQAATEGLWERMPPLVAVVKSAMTGLSAGRGALSYGYEHAPVAIACSPLPDGKRLVTIARASNARRMELDWTGLRDALCAVEPGWGGNATSGILGSPKPGGTTLDLDFIREVVARHVRWVTP